MVKFRKALAHMKDESAFLRHIWYGIRVPKFALLNRKLEKEVKRREQGEQDCRYMQLQKFKGIHDGQRCFIIATGPSLTMQDLDLLCNENTFGMNSIVKLYDQLSWRPTYYGIQDGRVYDKLESEIQKWYATDGCVFVGSSIADLFSVPLHFQQFPHNTAYHENQLELDKYFARFSDDAYSVVYDGYSITYSLIQIAVYMGFKEIYLLGADCSYKRGAKNHIVDSGNDDKNEEKNHDKMIVGYEKAKEYADAHGIKIVNCTRGGMLEVFERKSLEEVLGI